MSDETYEGGLAQELRPLANTLVSLLSYYSLDFFSYFRLQTQGQYH
jgi:hypothetical protein